MSVGIINFSSTQLQETSEQLGLDGKEGKTYQARTSEIFQGNVLDANVNVHKEMSVAVKTFKLKKSPARIMKEASLQQKCACTGASPHVLGVNLEEKYIVMQQLESLPVETYSGGTLPDDLQYMICGLMGRMDEAGVLHSDMNPRNVMVGTKGRPWMIDFGFAKSISKKVVRKHGARPNISVTLWGLTRGFRRNKVHCPILIECVESETPEVYIEKGNRLLQNKNKKRKR